MENKETKKDGRSNRPIESYFRRYADAEKKPEWQFKQFFLNKIKDIFPENRYNDMVNLLRKVSKWEEEFEKPVYNFTLVELKTMLEQFNSTSKMSLMSQKSNLEYYLLFAREQNVTNGILPATIDLSIDEIEQFINHIGSGNRFVTRDELYDLVISNLVNEVDKAIPLLIFEGILGKANSDLINLEWRNIDFQNCIIKSPNGKIIQINTVLAGILERANNQEVYLLGNGKTVKDERTKRDQIEILDKHESPYLLRPFINKNNQELQMTGSAIQRRVLTNCKIYLDRAYLTLSSIYISGLIDRGLRYGADTLNGELIRNTDWVNWLKENDEHVNVQDTYKLYKEFWGKEQKELEKLRKEQEEQKQQEQKEQQES